VALRVALVSNLKTGRLWFLGFFYLPFSSPTVVFGIQDIAWGGELGDMGCFRSTALLFIEAHTVNPRCFFLRFFRLALNTPEGLGKSGWITGDNGRWHSGWTK
jgi:ABC-type spermidine/putrescine transport system permease subunit II